MRTDDHSAKRLSESPEAAVDDQWSINAYLMAGRDGSMFPVAKRITCVDGFSLSVQATQGAYCSPRTNSGPWYSVEVGYPSAVPEFILSYAEDDANPTETVYGYVDIELVEKLIASHGGPDEATRARTTGAGA